MKSFSPLKWVGGKTRLAPDILPLLPPQPENYFEPFFGGGALFFAYGYKAKKQVFINDINLPLMNTYRMLASSDRDSLLTLVEEIGHGAYETIRDRFNEIKDQPGIESAAHFIVVNTMCFNSVYRENKKGKFNVPVGKNSKGHRNTCDSLDYDALRFAGRLMQGIHIENGSFTPWPFPVNPGKGDVVFFDPAYLKEFSQYNKSGFTVDDHKTLHTQALEHAANGATVIVCGSNNDASQAIYGQPTKVVALARTVGHSKRKQATECLWVYNGVIK